MNNDIPKIIYYCWFGGDKPNNVLNCINNWKEKLPDYNIVEVNDKTVDLFNIESELKNNLWFKICYENKIWAYVSDYVRLKVLYKNGGVYFDTDITVEKDIDDLLMKNKLVLGWQDKQEIAGGVIITPKENPIIAKMLEFYKEKIFKEKIYTIPQIITFTLKNTYILNSFDEITENDDIIIFPPQYFYPIPVGLKEYNNIYNERSYTIHWWNNSWGKSNIDYFLRNKHKMDLDTLLKYCFNEITIINNPFLKITKLLKQFSITLDFSYLIKLRFKYYGKHRYLTVFVAGIQIRLFRM